MPRWSLSALVACLGALVCVSAVSGGLRERASTVTPLEVSRLFRVYLERVGQALSVFLRWLRARCLAEDWPAWTATATDGTLALFVQSCYDGFAPMWIARHAITGLRIQRPQLQHRVLGANVGNATQGPYAVVGMAAAAR